MNEGASSLRCPPGGPLGVPLYSENSPDSSRVVRNEPQKAEGLGHNERQEGVSWDGG